jgi:hypothetical protein
VGPVSVLELDLDSGIWVAVDQDLVEISDTIATLFDLQGFGNIRNLHQAMARILGGCRTYVLFQAQLTIFLGQWLPKEFESNSKKETSRTVSICSGRSTTLAYRLTLNKELRLDCMLPDCADEDPAGSEVRLRK